MSDQGSLRHRLARTAALALGLGLASFVIIHAQFGCDSPASNAPPPKDTAPVEPAPAPAVQEPESEPAVVEPQPDPEPAAVVEPPSSLEAAAANPVFMPASKSGGDFGAMPFPGEQAPTQQQNPAPNKK